MTKSILLLICLSACLAVAALASSDQGSQKTSAPDPALLKRGSEIYKIRCALCHANEGKSPNVRMRFADSVWKHGDKPEEVAAVVADGVKGTAMMGFKNRLSPDDIKAVTAYVMGLSHESK